MNLRLRQPIIGPVCILPLALPLAFSVARVGRVGGGIAPEAPRNDRVGRTASNDEVAHYIVQYIVPDQGENSIALSDQDSIVIGFPKSATLPASSQNSVLYRLPYDHPFTLPWPFWYPQITARDQIAGDAYVNNAFEITVDQPGVNTWTPYSLENSGIYGTQINNNGDVIYFTTSTNTLKIYSTAQKTDIVTNVSSDFAEGWTSFNNFDQVAWKSKTGGIDTFIGGQLKRNPSWVGTPQDLADNGFLVTQNTPDTYVYNVNTLALLKRIEGFSPVDRWGFRCISNSRDHQRIIGLNGTNQWSVFDFSVAESSGDKAAVLPIVLNNAGWSIKQMGAINASNHIAAVVTDPQQTKYIALLVPGG